MTDQELYKSAVDFLLSFDVITIDDINRHLETEFKKPDDIKIVYKQLCSFAQNRQMDSKVIGQSIGGADNLKKVLFDFNPTLVAANFSKTDKTKLLDKIIEELKPEGQIRATNKSLWPQFCQSVIESAHFLKTFETANEFYKWADFFANNSQAKPALPLMISLEISGIGFPLACDFLEELGYVQFGKPDVHLKEIFDDLKMIDITEKPFFKQDYGTIRVIERVAKANGVSSYAVVKVFWLIGSGNFYLTKKNIGKHKKEFIKKILG